ncbi:MAG TPA: alpha/beta hydrolase [Nitrososphaeraceae archaeon]|nr:alpha/beta hydrolase [Nitrososphaeraceae archaeon]
MMVTVSLTVTTTHLGLANAQQKNNGTVRQSMTTNTTNTTNTNIVLVHGTAVDGSFWSKVIPILQNAGHKVIAVQLPLHSLADDIATTKRAISLVGGPVILVGHSYGGFVISNAAYNNPNVTGLVYLSAFAPNEGQSLSNFVDPAKLPKGFSILDSGGFIYVNPELFGQVLAQDIDPAEVKVIAAAQKPYNQSIATEKSGPPAWKQLPTWYGVTENDRIVPPAAQHMFAKQINATTISLPSSHASPLSHPNEVAQLILNAAKGAK